MDQEKNNISRRDFLKASAAAGLTVAGGVFFMNRNPVPRKADVLSVPSFGVKDTQGRFCLVRGADAKALVRKAVDGVGGIKTFVSKGDKVLLKVNCAFARPAWMGATSSPEVTGEVVRLCLEAGAAQVIVTDNPISDPKSCFLKSGLSKAVTEAGGEIMLPGPSDFRLVQVSKGVIGPWEVYHEPLKWCNKLIGIPTVKTHNLSGASLCMKNWYGFIGGSRARFHQDIHNVIVELGQFITPTLVILDGTRKLMKNGPTGGSASDVEIGNTVAASTDQVGIDALGAELLGLDMKKIEYIKMAQERGLGISNYRKLPGFKEVQI